MEKITTAASVSAAWRGMSDEEQYTALQKMAWTVRRGGSKCGAEWIQTQDDAMTAAAEAWLRMGAALERNERADEPRPLNLILYSACAQAANTIARREKRYFSATATLNQFGSFFHQITCFQSAGNQVVTDHNSQHWFIGIYCSGYKEEIFCNFTTKLESDVLHYFGGHRQAELNDFNAVNLLYILQQVIW